MPRPASTPFHRHLTEQALAAARPLAPLFAAWAREEGALVELRQHDTVSVYLRGRRAMHLVRLGSPSATLTLADGHPAQALELAPERLALAWTQARATLAAGRTVPEREALANLLSRGLEGLFVVDQEVQIPAAALQNPAAAGLRADALLCDRDGVLWLLEAKRADGDDLHAVVPQLVATAALPESLVGGESAFFSHYAEVLRQKVQLGLVRETDVPSEFVGIRTALLVVGPRKPALERIVAWEGIPEGLWAAVVERGLSVADFVPLETVAAEAARGLRDRTIVPIAPRPSRWNAFTAAEDARLATFPPAAPHPPALAAYLAEHDAPAHTHAGHARSSQRACLDAFAPAFVGGPGGDALIETLAPALRALHVHPLRVAAVDFEVPHQGRCLSGGCSAAHDMRVLAGETDPRFTTRLDVAVAVNAERAGRAVRVLVGVEFKYTEPEFGCCGGFPSPGNPDAGRRACLEPAERAARCYLLSRKHRRYLADRGMFQTDPLSAPGPCLLLGPVNQLYRSHFVVRALAEAWGFDDHLFVVVADDRNLSLRSPEPTIPGHPPPMAPPYERYREALRPELRPHLHGTSPAAMAAALHARGVELPGRYSWGVGG